MHSHHVEEAKATATLQAQTNSVDTVYLINAVNKYPSSLAVDKMLI